jgi:phospholipid/cholesterol/gamma-HCH transport system substrate-binding protein
MRGKAQKIRLGIFVMISSILLLLMIGFFTARKLFEKSDTYYVAYQNVSVSGLEVGSPVKYIGINVGTIAEISIDPKDVNKIIVRLSLKQGTPVKVDASADIVSMGITGLKTIEIRGGSNEADYLEPEKFILQGSSLVDDITGKTEVIAYKVEEILNNLIIFTNPVKMKKIPETIDKIAELADNANKTMILVNEVVKENQPNIQATFAKTNQISNKLEQTTVELHEAIARFNSLMQSDTLGEILGNLRDISVTLRETKLKELIENVALTAIQTQKLLIKLETETDKGSQDIEENLRLLKQTLQNLEDLSRKINTDPSILVRGQRAKDNPDKKLH